jgi:hypothetical protein
VKFGEEREFGSPGFDKIEVEGLILNIYKRKSFQMDFV